MHVCLSAALRVFFLPSVNRPHRNDKTVHVADVLSINLPPLCWDACAKGARNGSAFLRLCASSLEISIATLFECGVLTIVHDSISRVTFAFVSGNCVITGRMNRRTSSGCVLEEWPDHELYIWWLSLCHWYSNVRCICSSYAILYNL